jgi:hypothetical protein
VPQALEYYLTFSSNLTLAGKAVVHLRSYDPPSLLSPGVGGYSAHHNLPSLLVACKTFKAPNEANCVLLP